MPGCWWRLLPNSIANGRWPERLIFSRNCSLSGVKMRIHVHNMKENMKQRYRVFLHPWGTYYFEDLVTGKQETLKTRDKDEAFRLVAAKNENEKAPAFSLHLHQEFTGTQYRSGSLRHWLVSVAKIGHGRKHR